MTFPNIDVNKPLGTYRVSTIDDYERETRRWLRDCMMEISGYPDSSALKIAVWTTATRPHNPSVGTFGFNTTIGQIEYWDGTRWVSMSPSLPDICDKARKDQYGNVIDLTYATKTELAEATQVFVGATANADGEKGIVPKPVIGDQNKWLKGDGTWSTLPEAASISEGTLAELEAGTNTTSKIWSASVLADALEAANADSSIGSIGANGYLKLANGLIIQWGKRATGGGGGIGSQYRVTYPTPFTTALYSLNISPYGYDNYSDESTSPTNPHHCVWSDTDWYVGAPTLYDKLTGFWAYSTYPIYWMALGK